MPLPRESSPFVRQPTGDKRRPWTPRDRPTVEHLIETVARKVAVREIEALSVERAMDWPDRVRYVLGVLPVAK